MIKLILLDLDGTLISAREIHYRALNMALGKEYEISLEDHLGRFDGLTTKTKLNILSTERGLPIAEHDKVWSKKQELTLELFSKELIKDDQIINTFKRLKEDGYKLGVCSNSIRRTIYTALSRIGIIEYIDIIVSADDVNQPKPHPEIYWLAISKMGMLPDETMIVEDNPHGLLSAYRSHVKIVHRVSSPKDVTYNNILSIIRDNNTVNTVKSKWKDSKLNILIPMAGAGSRFQQAGYSLPKPLIEIHGKPMIKIVVENLGLDANYIFVVQKSHRNQYNLDTVLNMITPGCKIIETDGLTEGAACTALLAKDLINNDNPLFFANSDQFVEWNPSEFMYKMQESNVDGGIVTFEASSVKWSYAKIDDQTGLVIEVAEKNPISNKGTTGFYWWKHGSDFVKYAEQMISRNIRVNNEFYVCPVFNQAIKDGKKIKTFDAEQMWGVGVPEDLDYFLKNYKGKV